ncbi:hypothetical protein SEPCBS57363_002932 [Sporothrix epigloea]|uniref:Uncharacterized protein n=1 Tax=Sporothrix epigloea TaxID=1892477 RepID=A0ABP0DIM7_9PEZI
MQDQGEYVVGDESTAEWLLRGGENDGECGWTGSVDESLDETDDKYLQTRTPTRNTHRTWRSYIWDSWDRPPDERRLMNKIDAVVLSFASIGYLLKALDQNSELGS